MNIKCLKIISNSLVFGFLLSFLTFQQVHSAGNMTAKDNMVGITEKMVTVWKKEFERRTQPPPVKLPESSREDEKISKPVQVRPVSIPTSPPRRQKTDNVSIELTKSVMIPAKNVNPGEEMTIMINYAVTGSPVDGANVNQKQTLWYNDIRLMTINEKDVNCTDGTYEDSLVFTIPQIARPGSYKIIQTISTPSSSKEIAHFFTVW